MKATLLLPLFVGTASAAVDIQTVKAATPVQTFYVPIPEADVFTASFEPTSSRAKGPVTSIISLSISTNNTVVWYDHWEDGYEDDVSTGYKNTTQIWGDGNKTNGCAFGTPCNSDSDDFLVAGQSIVIENDVPLDHSTKKEDELFDARDKIMASYHIAITRGSYPKSPGSYMAGAVEVYDTGSWGQQFEAPFGNRLKSTSDSTRKDAYEKTVLFFMAHEDDTKIMANGKTYTLNEGESHYEVVNQGDIVTSTKDVQADIVTSDLNSSYELRWYSLLANKYWSHKYLTPMGDSTSRTRVVMYNPGSNKLTVNVKTPTENYNVEVPGKSSQMTRTIQTNHTALLTSNGSKKFIAMSQTDTLSSGNNNDWGFPLVPFDQLTTQVLIGWGYGCKGQTCSGTNRKGQKGSRSVVYVGCEMACDVYVDVDNDGSYDQKIHLPFMRGTRITDENDHDMSGAVIWSTKPGKGPKGTAVRMTAAWGQDPERSWGGDQEAMDLGTVVLPFGTVKVSETVKLLGDKDNNGVISAGDVLKYTIRIQNMGQIDILPNQLVVKGPITAPALTQRQYVKGTCRYDNAVGLKTVCDDASLGIIGLKNPYTLPKLGGYHDITFKAVIDDISQITTNKLPQFGQLYKGNEPPLPFSVNSKILFSANIKLIKTIHRGDVTCSVATRNLGPTDSKLVKAAPGSAVTYCYRIINTGKSYLKLGLLNDPDISFTPNVLKNLGPNKQHFVKVIRSVGANPDNSTATITANPIYVGGSPLPDMDDVKDTDAAGYDILFPDADVEIQKTVHTGHWAKCTKGDEMVTGYNNDKVTYCYAVKNIGDTYLKSFTIDDSLTGFTSSHQVPLLAPGATHYLPGHTTKITKSIFAQARVVATPSLPNGAAIPGMSSVSDLDPAGVRLIAKQVVPCVGGSTVGDWTPTPLTAVPMTKLPDPTPKPYVVFKPDFSTSAVQNKFTVKQNTFRGTTMGHNMARSYYDSGKDALKLVIGQYCNPSSQCTGGNRGMSGGYSVKFELKNKGKLKISYTMDGDNDVNNDPGENGYGYVSLNGKILGSHTYFLNGSKTDTSQGWKNVERTVAVNNPGVVEVIIGGYFTKRTTWNEKVTFMYKNVEIKYEP